MVIKKVKQDKAWQPKAQCLVQKCLVIFQSSQSLNPIDSIYRSNLCPTLDFYSLYLRYFSCVTWTVTIPSFISLLLISFPFNSHRSDLCRIQSDYFTCLMKIFWWLSITENKVSQTLFIPVLLPKFCKWFLYLDCFPHLSSSRMYSS